MISKKTRIVVHEKHNGHCGYCGNFILYKEMQVDHIRPQRNGGTDDIDNLMPTCRRCNHYKRAYSLSKFRSYMKTIHERIAADYITKVGMDYGVVIIKPWDGVFYFEKFKP